MAAFVLGLPDQYDTLLSDVELYLMRTAKVRACADGTSGYTFSDYWGVVVIFPEARSSLAAPIAKAIMQAILPEASKAKP